MEADELYLLFFLGVQKNPKNMLLEDFHCDLNDTIAIQLVSFEQFT